MISSIGYFALARVRTSTIPLPLFAFATFLLSLGASPVFTLTNDVIIGSAPPERAGAASGISETCAELGGPLGIAFFGSIGVAIYRGVLAQLAPLGLSADMIDGALSTLGGAVAMSRQLPSEIGTSLMKAANDAFVRGLVFCSMISGAGSLVLAAFAAVTFRGVGVAPQHTGEHQVGLVT